MDAPVPVDVHVDVDAWDDICANPHQEHLDKGREEGLEAGRVSGYRDGSRLGIVKGIEYGLELGFIRECCRTLQIQHQHTATSTATSTSTRNDNDKALVEIRAVTDLLDSFPQPNQLFPKQEQSKPNNPNHLQKEDLQEHMQRIRNKLKLLSLRFNNNSIVTLKQLLQNQSNSNQETPPPMEW